MTQRRKVTGKDVWLMGSGGIIASFLDERVMTPVFIGDGIPLIARRHRHLPLDLISTQRFEDRVVQLHYRVPSQEG